MITAGGDAKETGLSRNDTGLAMAVIAPGGQRAIGFESQTVQSACGDGDYVAQPGRNRGLPVVVSAPGGNRSVALESEAMISAGGNRGYISQTGGDICRFLCCFAPSRKGLSQPAC